MRLYSVAALFALALAGGSSSASEAQTAGQEKQQIKGVLQNLLDDNVAFMKDKPEAHFRGFVDKQTPRATVVACSDSRVHTHAFDKDPDNDLFIVRNIGNQLATAEGSVEYGVHHLRTPVLIFVGHTACGAVKAAMGDPSGLSLPIRRELVALEIPRPVAGRSAEDAWLDGVKANVNHQVAQALRKFAAEVKEGHLLILGAVYDFRNDLKQGHGRLLITNVNGETDVAKVQASVKVALD
jgi:carbonic anhydrase